jgi:hypothetical protein
MTFENRLRSIRQRVRSFQRDWRNTANAFQLAYPHDDIIARRNLPKIKQIYDAAKRWIAREQNATMEGNWHTLQHYHQHNGGLEYYSANLTVRLRFPAHPFTVYVSIRLRHEPRRTKVARQILVTPGEWWVYVESWSIIGSHVLLATELDNTPSWSIWSPTIEFEYITFSQNAITKGDSRLVYNGSDISLARSQRKMLAKSATLFPTGKRLPGGPNLITLPQDEFEEEIERSTQEPH